MASESTVLRMKTESRYDRILRGIFGLLILYVASVILISLASLPRYYHRVTTGAVPTLTVGGEDMISNAMVASWAAERGMDLQTYAVYSIVLNTVIMLGFASVAGLILWKARRQWFHWFTALVLLFAPTGLLWEFTMVSRIALYYVELGSVLWPAFLLFLYLFPNGRAVPGWMKWIIGVIVVIHFTIQTAGVLALFGLTTDAQMQAAYQIFPVILSAFPLILFSQIYRYIRVSDKTERAQIKWFVAGLALWLFSGYIIELFTMDSAGAATTETGLGGDINDLLMLIIPASIGIGILRYRLYDIDVIIRRTLVYGLLTAILALLYFGSVIVFQQLFHVLTGEQGQSSLAIVVSTLAIAALFDPLRRQVQSFIDRRFYRQRYDARETLQAFAGTMRQEIMLEDLSSRLTQVVQKTMQPEEVTLWLRDVSAQPERGDRQESIG